MQTPILNARVKDLLPVVLDYKDFTNEPQTKKLTEKIMDFYASDHHGIQDDSTIIMNHVSQVRLSFFLKRTHMHIVYFLKSWYKFKNIFFINSIDVH